MLWLVRRKTGISYEVGWNLSPKDRVQSNDINRNHMKPSACLLALPFLLSPSIHQAQTNLVTYAGGEGTRPSTMWYN